MAKAGFTLLEILVVLVLLGFLAGMFALQLPMYLSQTHLHGATRRIVTDLQYIRVKAITQNRRFRVTFRPATGDYIVESDDEGRWKRQQLLSHSDEEVPQATISLPRDIRITAINSGGDVIFLPRGAVDGGLSVTLGTVGGTHTRRVIVNLAGRVRIE
ncbi:MAG: GspH/FimT family protein [Candidatus Binatia bacterium]